MPGQIKIDDGAGNYTILTNAGSLGSDKTITIPNETATLATTNGITGADQWRLTTDQTTQADVTSWERGDGLLQGSYIGTGMTHSSGVFTFPKTGLWFVLVGGHMVTTTTNGIGDLRLTATDDNFSSDSDIATGRIKSGTGDDESKIYISSFVNISDTTNDKVKVRLLIAGTVTLKGSNTSNETEITFVRLGE